MIWELEDDFYKLAQMSSFIGLQILIINPRIILQKIKIIFPGDYFKMSKKFWFLRLDFDFSDKKYFLEKVNFNTSSTCRFPFIVFLNMF